MTDTSKSYHHGNLAPALIAATVALIEERGVEHVSVREVARRAGVSPGAPFRHFSSKAQLLAAVAEQAMERLAESVRAAQGPDDSDPLAQIERIGQGYLIWARAHPTHFQIVSARNLVDFDAASRMRTLNDDIRARMLTLLEAARAQGDLTPEADIGTILLSCRALVYGLARMYVDGHFPEWQPDGQPAPWMEKALADYVLRLRSG